jgi:hypothetical protein
MATAITAYEGDDSIPVKKANDREHKSPSTRSVGSREGRAMSAETTLGEEAAAVVDDDDQIYVKKVEHPENRSQSGPQG